MCLPLKLARSLGHISQLALCTSVTTSLHFTDPQTLQGHTNNLERKTEHFYHVFFWNFSSLSVAELPSSVYWRSPFSSLCNHRQLIEFYVLHIEKATPPECHGVNDKCVLCDVWVVPVNELGVSDKQIHCRSHLGHLLHTGDTVWG